MPLTRDKLWAPQSFLDAPQWLRDQYMNGCGTDGWKGGIVPETIWGLCITPSCNIHDWMYAHGKTIEDKREADRVFLNNMLRQVERGSCWFLKPLRRRRALKYYEAVNAFGGPAFWAEKEDTPESMTT